VNSIHDLKIRSFNSASQDDEQPTTSVPPQNNQQNPICPSKVPPSGQTKPPTTTASGKPFISSHHVKTANPEFASQKRVGHPKKWRGPFSLRRTKAKVNPSHLHKVPKLPPLVSRQMRKLQQESRCQEARATKKLVSQCFILPKGAGWGARTCTNKCGILISRTGTSSNQWSRALVTPKVPLRREQAPSHLSGGGHWQLALL
jgi:hypothetical protein